jgi:hypothetical protein
MANSQLRIWILSQKEMWTNIRISINLELMDIRIEFKL